MNTRLRIEVTKASEMAEKILAKRWPRAKMLDAELTNSVEPIIDEVKKRGDAALIDFTFKFDGVKLSPSQLKADKGEIEKAYEEVNAKQISAIEFAKKRLESSEKALLARVNFEYEAEGIKTRRCTRPIRSVGCYVPGGEASYPSTVVMMAVPAKVAGVPRIVICSPPKGKGEINPLTLVAADICGVDEVYKVGGVQAIAAMTYGTETIRPVEKIVGPGNKYVLMAKRLVSQDVPVDLPAGPSEILVLADASADARTVALDMISQAEHGADGVSILVTTSMQLAEKVVKELKAAVSSLPKSETVIQALSRNGSVLVCEGMDEAVAFVNEFAPEHLEVMAKDAWKIAEKITSAGLVLIGKYSPVASSDYCLGTDHVLPTGGFSRVFSGLSVLDFVKRFSIAECPKEGLSNIRGKIRVLAESEGLANHALAVEERFRVE
jgi:histidinol dehydrogenase